jgi:hypothetical protein
MDVPFEKKLEKSGKFLRQVGRFFSPSPGIGFFP